MDPSQILDGSWLKLFTGIDVTTLIAVGAIAFFLEYIQAVTDKQAVIATLLLGAVVGGATGYQQQVEDGSTVLLHVMNGAIRYGGFGCIIGRLTALWLRKSIPMGPSTVGKAISDAATTQMAVESGAVPTVNIAPASKNGGA